MSLKSASNISGIQRVDEHDHQQEITIPSFRSQQNRDTSEHEEKSNILQLPRQFKSILPSIIHTQKDRRRRAQAFTRWINVFIVSYIYGK